MPRGMVLIRLLAPSSLPASHQLGLVSQRLRLLLGRFFPVFRLLKICMEPIRRWPDAIPRQSNHRRRQEDANAVVGDSLCNFGCPGTADLVRSLREVNSRSSDYDFGSGGDYRNRNEVEAETACVVLDHHDRFCGSSCPVGLVGSVDDQVGSCLRDNPNRHGRFIPNALGPLSCREVHGRAGNC
jgi:hypothetical protein